MIAGPLLCSRWTFAVIAVCVAVIAVCVAVIAVCVAAFVTAGTPASAASYRSPYEVPVHDCSSWYGVRTTQATRPLGPIFATLPSGLGGQVSFVTDTAQTISPILTFTNWACSFGVGADGTWGLTSTNDATTSERIEVTDPVVTLLSNWSLLCHLYPSIDFLYPNETCPSIARHGERVTKRIGGVTYFTDQPGVVGTAPGSGGRLATRGAALYYGSTSSAKERSSGYGIVMGCPLPASRAATCQVLLKNFVSRHLVEP
jgi:hypothetical protein